MAAGARKVVLEVNRRLMRELATVGRASSPELVSVSRVLARSIRKTLGGAGDAFQGPLLASGRSLGRAPSRPGQPPAKQSGQLQKSVKRGVVGAAQRVAVMEFYAPFLEFGINTEADAATGRVRTRRDLFTREALDVLVASRQRQERRQRARNRGRDRKGRPAHRLVIAPRPFMERALGAVRDRMVDVTVSEIRRRLPSA